MLDNSAGLRVTITFTVSAYTHTVYPGDVPSRHNEYVLCIWPLGIDQTWWEADSKIDLVLITFINAIN